MKQPSFFQTKRIRGLSRREFITRCGACSAFAACASAFPFSAIEALGKSSGRRDSFGQANDILKPAALLSQERAKVRLIFTHVPPDQPTWPYQVYDYEARKSDLLSRLRQSCPQVDFLPATIQKPEEADSLLQRETDIDGYIVYLIGIWTGVPRRIIQSDRPTLLVDDLYAGSGEFLIEYARARRENRKVIGVSSSRFEDIIEAVNCFDCLKKLRTSRVLVVTDNETMWGDPRVIKEVFGTDVERVFSPEISEAYGQADPLWAAKWARHWIQNAEMVGEPSREEIEKSAAMYQAMQSLLVKHKALAIAIDCLGLFYGGKLPAYPCLGFFQLNNDGLVGACEGDLPSTIMMLMMTYLVGRPGYISDPVIDASTNQIIYAHCVAPNKVFGSGGVSNPYHIRSHSEDRKGAAVRSLMPVGEITTSLEFNCSRKEIVVHQSTTVANVEEDKACRTKLAAEILGDLDKLMNEWDRFGWHRVTFFGDHKKAVERMAALLGINLVHEA